MYDPTEYILTEDMQWLHRDSKEPYGDVDYADPGYQSDGKKRYPLDTEKHVKAAWSYINQGDNAAKYTASQLASIKSKIKAAAKKFGIEISENALKVGNIRGRLPGVREVRSYPAEFSVTPMAGTRVKLTGYASTFNQPYSMYDMFGEYTESVRSGAFNKTLSEGPDVGFLANHGGLILARTKSSQSLVLREDSIGLLSEAMINTERSDARDLLTAIEDKDCTEMSFGFRIMRQEWDEDYENRQLVELNLDRGDVSAVNFGANPNTSIAPARAFHHMSAARAHAIETKLRAGEPLSSGQLDALTRTLHILTDGDVVSGESVVQESERVPEYLLLLRRRVLEDM